GFGGGGPRPGAGAGFGPEANFENFNFGPEGFTRASRRGRAGAAGGGGFGGFEDILKEAFGRSGARGGAGANFEPEDFGVGADMQAEMSVSLPDAANGSTQRLHLPNGKDVDVKIPAGITGGQQIRLKGQGMPGQHGAGDLLITVSIAPHPVFTLEGTDVRLELPITLYEATLGAKVRVPTLDKPVEVTIPPWTSSGRTFRLKGKGFPAKSRHGDLLATVRIVLPDKSDAELDALMKKWLTEKPYDPRKDM
ncbi:MAG: DnaJ C-terminal domain-containing protein, partial [Xanthobacteraceae bacterium]